MQIDDLLDGTFIKDETSSSYRTKTGFIISRVNVFGIVISKESNDFFSSIIIEDGSGKIDVRSFEKKDVFDDIEVENIVNVIGKIREYNQMPFISVELIKKSDQDFFNLRKKELSSIKKFYPKAKEEPNISEAEELVVAGDGEKILSMLNELDKGDGVDTELLIEKSGIKNAEGLIKELINNGDVFEIRPGKLKVLN